MTVELIANSPTPGSVVPIATLAAAVLTAPAAGTIETWTYSSAPPAALQTSGGQFRITLGSEICVDVTGGGGTSRSVQRGAEGSTTAVHALGTPVLHEITAGGLANYLATNGISSLSGGTVT